MFNTLNEKALATKLAITGFIAGAYGRVQANREAGQGAVEYVGIILVVGAIILVLVTFGEDIGNAIGGKITEAVENIGE